MIRWQYIVVTYPSQSTTTLTISIRWINKLLIKLWANRMKSVRCHSVRVYKVEFQSYHSWLTYITLVKKKSEMFMQCWNALQWRHYEPEVVSNHQPRDCLLNRPFRRRSKKTSKLRVTGLCVGNSPVTSYKYPTQMASNAENVPIWWRYHVSSKGRVMHIYIYIYVSYVCVSVNRVSIGSCNGLSYSRRQSIIYEAMLIFHRTLRHKLKILSKYNDFISRKFIENVCITSAITVPASVCQLPFASASGNMAVELWWRHSKILRHCFMYM